MKKINWLKYRALYAVVSLLFIAAGVVNISRNGLFLGVEFSGGSALEFNTQKPISTESLSDNLAKEGVSVSSIQQSEETKITIKTSETEAGKIEKITAAIKSIGGEESQLLLLENIGPTISRDLLIKTGYAIAITALSIAFWIGFQFKNATYGISAILATLHDALILISVYSILGTLFGASMDFLFVTALLTTLSFSVHDTIVVYDRIRERKKHGGSIQDTANTAISETMRRSIYNSLTIALMLVILILLGGSSTLWFAAALLIGVVSGTYSSPFVAVPILVSWSLVKSRMQK